MTIAPPRSTAELEEHLSRPDDLVLSAIEVCAGDVVVVGAGGKMGPSLARMVRRAHQALGSTARTIAVSRWSSAEARQQLDACGVHTIAADVSDPRSVAQLPLAPNVIFMAGQKFGTQGAPGHTWFTNVVVPALVIDRYSASRITAFSTGNVYPLTPVHRGGATEEDAVAPVGEYAMSCVGRERIFHYAADTSGTRASIVRLNYAVDLRYGVLVDIAHKLLNKQPIDLTMGHVNCIWQRDANAIAIATLADCAAPPWIVNVTGPDTLPVRSLALALGVKLDCEPLLTGLEAPDALLSNTQRMQDRYMHSLLPIDTLIDWVAEWVKAGGTTSGKSTHYDVRTGAF